jgi:ribose/xylose/arabinose/galactoside ABC-type transport system permease subunit
MGCVSRDVAFNVVGTILGLLLVRVTVIGLTLTGAAPAVNAVCYGSALILAAASA